MNPSRNSSLNSPVIPKSGAKEGKKKIKKKSVRMFILRPENTIILTQLSILNIPNKTKTKTRKLRKSFLHKFIFPFPLLPATKGLSGTLIKGKKK